MALWLFCFCLQVNAFNYTWNENGKISDIELPETLILTSPDYKLGDPMPLSFSQALDACLLAVGRPAGEKTKVEFIRLVSHEIRGRLKYFFVVSWRTGPTSRTAYYAVVLLNGKVILPKK